VVPIDCHQNHKLPSWPTAAIWDEFPTWASDAEEMGTVVGTGSGFHGVVPIDCHQNHKLPSWPTATICEEFPTWVTFIVRSCLV
jgi:hypothetical protein